MNDTERRQLEQLRELSKELLRPLKRVPFWLVIETLTSHRVERFGDDARDSPLLDALAAAAMETVSATQRAPVQANRPNDVSVPIEALVKPALERQGVHPEKLRGSGGYPDLKTRGPQGLISFLEIKVSRVENIDTGSPRNFFYQPTEGSKIDSGARHLICAFAIQEVSEKKWHALNWRIADLWGLPVSLKPEFNADNRAIYSQDNLLATGDARRWTALR